MIVFNAPAVVVGIIIGLFLGPLYWAFPEFMDTSWGSVLAAGIVTVIGIITDLVGLKGRLFFLPIWLFGFIGMGVHLHKMWGWYGPALVAALVVMLVLGLMALGAMSEKKEWANAPANLIAARDAVVKGVNDETWELVAKAYFVPTWGDETPERCKHNLEARAQGDAGERGRTRVARLRLAERRLPGRARPEEEDRKSLLEEQNKAGVVPAPSSV